MDGVYVCAIIFAAVTLQLRMFYDVAMVIVLLTFPERSIALAYL